MLSYLVGQYNNAYHDSVSKNLLILIILQILKLLSLKLIIDPQLLIEQKMFLVGFTLKISQKNNYY